MKRIFTRNDLIRYLYHETNDCETATIEKSINDNYKLRKEFDELKEVIEILALEVKEPSETAVNSILLYSKCTEVLQGSSKRMNVICKN